MQKLGIVGVKPLINVPVATAVFFSCSVLMLSSSPITAAVNSADLNQEEAASAVQSDDTNTIDLEQERSLTRSISKEIRAINLAAVEAAKAAANAQPVWQPVKVVRNKPVSRSLEKVPYNVSELLDYAQSFKGVPYLYGGTDPRVGLDCSAFTQLVFRKFGVDLPRISYQQFRVGVGIARNNLQPGDLVFFSTNGAGATHVGIYLGEGNFISATNKGVRIENINSTYWNKNYRGSRRVSQ